VTFNYGYEFALNDGRLAVNWFPGGWNGTGFDNEDNTLCNGALGKLGLAPQVHQALEGGKGSVPETIFTSAVDQQSAPIPSAEGRDIECDPGSSDPCGAQDSLVRTIIQTAPLPWASPPPMTYVNRPS